MAEGVCIVCGSVRTVKTHLFPRALMLDMRGDAKTLYAGSRHRDGRVERQNGQWDSRFLCAEHEAMFGPGDDYGVKICRSIASLPIAEGAKAVTVDNPRPDLLARFVYACVWRHAMAPLNAPLRLRLGPYEQKLRSALFEDGPLDLQIVPGVSGLTGANGPVNCAVEPYRQKLGSLWTWHFVIGRLEIHLKTDARPFPKEWADLLADRDPMTSVVADATDIATTRLLSPITDRIRRSAARR